MFISDRAAEAIDAALPPFCHRSDYEYLPGRRISMVDYKGASTAAAVFHTREKAEEWIDAVLAQVDALGDGPEGFVYPLTNPMYGDEPDDAAMFVATITGCDFVVKGEAED